MSALPERGGKPSRMINTKGQEKKKEELPVNATPPGDLLKKGNGTLNIAEGRVEKKGRDGREKGKRRLRLLIKGTNHW